MYLKHKCNKKFSNMIITKETQEKIVGEYLKNNSTEKTQGFADGINAAIELIKKNSDKSEVQRESVFVIKDWISKLLETYPDAKVRYEYRAEIRAHLIEFIDVSPIIEFSIAHDIMYRFHEILYWFDESIVFVNENTELQIGDKYFSWNN